MYQNGDEIITRPNPMNIPINYFPEGVPTVYAEIWLHTDISVLSEECLNLNQTSDGEPIFINNLGQFKTHLHLNSNIIKHFLQINLEIFLWKIEKPGFLRFFPLL